MRSTAAIVVLVSFLAAMFSGTLVSITLPSLFVQLPSLLITLPSHFFKCLATTFSRPSLLFTLLSFFVTCLAATLFSGLSLLLTPTIVGCR